MDFFQQFGIDVPPIGVALEDPERLEEQEDQLKNLVDLIPQQGITEIKLPRTEQTIERYLTPDKSQRKPKRKKLRGYDVTKGGSYTEYGTEDKMVGINKQLLDYANAIEKLPKKKPKKRKGIASSAVTRHDSGVPMTAVTDASAFGHELRDQNTVKALLGVVKHLQGQHDQSSHGRGKGKGSATKGSEDYGSDKALAILKDKFEERGGFLWMDVKGSDSKDYQLFSNGGRYELYEGKHAYRNTGGLGSDYMPTGMMVSKNIPEHRIGISRRANIPDRPDIRRSTKYDIVVNMNTD